MLARKNGLCVSCEREFKNQDRDVVLEADTIEHMVPALPNFQQNEVGAGGSEDASVNSFKAHLVHPLQASAKA